MSPENSIHAEQPEDTRDDLVGPDAVEKIRELVKDAQTCFFCTMTPVADSLGSRPMNVREVDDDGNFWFLSSVDSNKNAEVQAEETVRLYLQGSAHSGFLAVEGTATVSRDPKRIDDLWNPMIKTWFTEGKDDPRITVIKVTPTEAYYWDNKHGNAVAGIKMLLGAAIGKTLDDSVEGTLTV